MRYEVRPYRWGGPDISQSILMINRMRKAFRRISHLLMSKLAWSGGVIQRFSVVY